MVENIPFGKYKGSSVEQIAVNDYNYFAGFLVDEVDIKKRSLRERVEFVEYVGNNFISVLPCALDSCDNPARIVSIYDNPSVDFRTSSYNFIYCSSECFNHDPMVTDQLYKVNLEPLGFRTALSRTKQNTNHLMGLMLKCMGMKEGRKTREYLEDFFDNVETR